MKLDEDLEKREPCGAVAAPEQLLAERAANAARAELRGERTGILGAIGSSAPPLLLSRTRRVPERWSLIHVMERMEEAFRILARLPTATRPRGYINSMPFYVYDRGDLNAQLETYELERLAQGEKPRAAAAVARRDRPHGRSVALAGGFISAVPNFIMSRARSISARCGRHSIPMPTRRLKRMKITRRTFNARKLQGLQIITRELVRRRVPIR